MYKVLRHTCFAFELFAINATSARLPHLKTLTWQTVTLTDSHYLTDQATRLGGSTHLSCARDQDKIRNYTGRQVISPTWGILPPCKQALTYRTENTTTHKLWLIKQMEPCGYCPFRGCAGDWVKSILSRKIRLCQTALAVDAVHPVTYFVCCWIRV